MRYLNKRSDFLNKVNEEITAGTGGPFHNDLGWNDSLLGRLINHTLRKVKIGIKVQQIKPLVKSLKQEFDNIIDQSRLESASSEVKAIALRAKIALFFKELIDSVNKGEEVSTLIKITDSSIEDVTSLDDFDKKDIIIKELEDFKAFLEKNNDSGASDSSSSSDKSSYTYMVRNLKALSLILSNISNIKTDVSLNIEIGKEYLYKGKVVKVVNLKNTQKPGNDKEWLTSDDIIGKDEIDPKAFVIWRDPVSKEYKPNAASQSVEKSDLKAIKEATTFATGGSRDRNSIMSGESHSTQAINKLKTDAKYLMSSKEKGISIDFDFINSILKSSNTTDGKQSIKNLYSEILSYLIGDKKATIQDKDALFKESVDILSDKNKMVIVAEKIARFSKRAIQFDGQNLYGTIGDLGKPLKDFVDSLKYIMKSNSNESVISYNSFIMVRESNISDASTKIKEYFDENCKNVKEFKIEESEVNKANSEIEKVDVSENVQFEQDSIINIVKLFNRAYKLYTVKTITKRSENVDTNTLSEYTSFGGNGESGRSGPYRNNKIFQIWEDGVYSILGDRKYQAIFTKNAKLKLPKVINPKGPEDYEVKENAGQNLRTFINKMMDGDNIYKGEGGAGQINTMLEKYFGSGVKEEATKELKGDKDVDDNNELANKIEELSIKLKFVNADKDPKNRMVFLINCSVNGESNKQRTFFINGIENGIVYMVGSVSYKRVEKLLYATKNTKFSVNKGDFPRELNNGDYKFIYTKMKLDDFKKYMKDGMSLKMTSSTNSGSTSFKTDEIEIDTLHWLVNDKSDGYFVPKDDIKNLSPIFKKMGEREEPLKFIKGLPESIKIEKK